MARLSPLKIEILLHYWYSPTDYPGASPAHREALDEFVRLGILRVSAKVGVVYEGNAEALKVYFDALCAVPLPERRWIVPTPIRSTAMSQEKEQEGSGVSPAKVIEGWMRPSDSGPGYELGKGAGWCEFNECGQPEHGDVPATLVIGEKAWPESKVRELLKAIQTGVYRGKLGEGPQHTINRIAKEHGLTI